MQLFRQGLFEDQVFLVTGGGSGIGLEICLQAGELGAKVAICGRREAVLKEAADLLASKNIPCLYRVCDIRKDEEIQEMIKATLEKFKKIDVLVSNAGGQYRTTAEECKPKGFEAVVRNNLLGTWKFIYYTVNMAFIPQKKGCIVNIIAQIRL